MRTSSIVTGALLAIEGALAQGTLSVNTRVSTTSDFLTATGTNTGIAQPTATGEPCALISEAIAEYSGSGTVRLNPRIAYECARSAPIVKEDALRLLSIVSAMTEWQSTTTWLKNPPAGYLLQSVDLIGEIDNIRTQVENDEFTSEIDFQGNLTNVLKRAHDGHLNINLDAASVFVYRRATLGLVSLSANGTSAPQIYQWEDVLAVGNGLAETAEAITQINGVDAAEFLQNQGQNVSLIPYQDPDTIYNAMLWAQNSGQPGEDIEYPGLFVATAGYDGLTTSMTFENGSTIEIEHYATVSPYFDFRGVVDGETFYTAFCNASAKAEALGLSTLPPSVRAKRGTKGSKVQELVERQTTTSSGPVTSIIGYPSPVAIAEDGSMSGYFLTETGFEDVAVLVLTSMSEGASLSFQATMTEFLDACRQQGKTHLVMDVSGNPGGNVGLGYDTFKQLFTNLEPYGASQYRGIQQLDLLGAYYTNISAEIQDKMPYDDTLFQAAGGYLPWSAVSYNNASGDEYTNWEDFYGPVRVINDNYTNLIRQDLDDPLYAASALGQITSGYANMSDVPPPPFEPENMIILSDGQCSSTCTILHHFLKWQAKVKSIAIGGRPTTAAMQEVGGVKGSQVYQYLQLGAAIINAYQFAESDTLEGFRNSALQTIYDNVDYFALRTRSTGSVASDFQFNLANNIAAGDESYTPLQFAYEAADCHLWYQGVHLLDIRTKWQTAAAQAFGIAGVERFSLCVKGSTNHPTSLSGNSTLFNNGNPTNVTAFTPMVDGEESGNGDESAAGRMIASSSMAVVFAVVVALLM